MPTATRRDPPPEAWVEPEHHRHRLLLQGIAQPERITIDGETLPPTAFRRVRGPDGRAALVSIGRIPVESGFHEVQVDTWGEPSQVRVFTDDSSADGATIVVERKDLPKRARWSARPGLLDPWVRPERFELRPSLTSSNGRVGIVTYSTTAGTSEHATPNPDSQLYLQVPVRLNGLGGRVWAEATPRIAAITYQSITYESRRVGDISVIPSRTDPTELGRAHTLVWTGLDLFAGVSGGNLLSWELSAGATANPRLELDDAATPLPRTAGHGWFVYPRVALQYGTNWRVRLDATPVGIGCLFTLSCEQLHLDTGLTVTRTLGRVDPFLRTGLWTFYELQFDDPSAPTEFDLTSLGGFFLQGGVAIHPGRRWRLR